MVYEKCEKCGHAGTPEDPCECPDTRKIHVDVTMTAEMKDLQRKLFEAEELAKAKDAEYIVANEALRAADEKARNWDNYVKTHPPAGKASLEPPKGGEEYASQVAMIDELYNRAYYKKEDYTPEQVKEAKTKISTLLESMVNGPSWAELGKRGAHEIMKHNLMECPECHATKVDVDVCPKCGYDPTEKKRVAKVRIYKGVKRED